MGSDVYVTVEECQEHGRNMHHDGECVACNSYTYEREDGTSVWVSPSGEEYPMPHPSELVGVDDGDV